MILTPVLDELRGNPAQGSWMQDEQMITLQHIDTTINRISCGTRVNPPTSTQSQTLDTRSICTRDPFNSILCN